MRRPFFVDLAQEMSEVKWWHIWISVTLVVAAGFGIAGLILWWLVSGLEKVNL